jgi:hypothetical protein
MVLLRIPGMAGKLKDAWNGPYEIYKKVNYENYEVIVPNRKNRKKIVHVNNCNAWSCIIIVMIVEEVEKTKVVWQEADSRTG